MGEQICRGTRYPAGRRGRLYSSTALLQYNTCASSGLGRFALELSFSCIMRESWKSFVSYTDGCTMRSAG